MWKNRSSKRMAKGPEGILIVDKPVGWTSHDVVAFVRKAFRPEKVGHAGTLDPFATGVLVLMLGRAFTKRSACFSACDKEYLATLKLGVETDTGDPEGRIVSENSSSVDKNSLEGVLSKHTGELLQTVPMTSAKKVKGKKLYELARKGLETERAPQRVEIKKLELLGFDMPIAKISVVCSKGTYIRQLALDIGSALGVGAYLTELRRVRSGSFTISQAVDMETLKKMDRCGLDEKILRV